MQLSIIRQTPAVSILLMLLLVAMAFTRFALAPYADELVVGEATTLGAWLDAFQSGHPVISLVVSALLVVMSGMSLGRMGSALGLYRARTTVTIPLYALIACGIFLTANTLAVALSAYFAVRMLRHLCSGYVKGTDLNHAFYAGICAGLFPLLYAPASTLILLLPIAVVMFGLSWREIVVMIAGALLPSAALCYIFWFCGGEFWAPLLSFFEALSHPTGYTLWWSESVVALTMMGLLLFAAICGIIAYMGDKRSVAIRPRIVLAFYIIALIIACASFALPSATTALFMFVAMPAAVLIPVGLLRLRDAISNLVVITLVVLMILHIFIA